MITAAITPLTAVAKYGSINALNRFGINTESAYGTKGASIAIAASAQVIKVIIAHFERTILGLGVSVKSAPVMPYDKEMLPIANTRKIGSKNAIIVERRDGL